MADSNSSDPGESNTPRADGGRIEDFDVFTTEQTDELASTSPADRIERLVDLYLYAPFKVAWRDWRARIGGTITLLYLFMGTFGVVLVPKPQINAGPRYLGAFQDPRFPLGTDALGQGIGKQIVHATPAMLQFALAGVVFAAVVAVSIGLISGYVGGSIDSILMTFTDIVLTLPGLPVILIIAAIYPPRDPFMVGVIIAIDSWPGLARQLRSQVMTLREEDYVESARAMGRAKSSIIVKDVLPQLAPLIAINIAGAAGGVIGASVGLYFLGILPFTTLNWGVMMNLARTQGAAISNPARAGHWLFFPALTLSLLLFGLILFAQGLDRVFNPRIRARYASSLSDEEGEGDGESTATTSVTSMQK